MEKPSQPHNAALPRLRAGLNKAQISDMARDTVEGVLEEGSPLALAEGLAAMDEFVRTVRKDERFVQTLRDELHRHGGSLKTGSGAKVELCEAGVRYDYTAHPEWKALEARIAELRAEQKALEERLRRLGPGRLVVDTETGEVTEGALKQSRSTYRITLAR